LHANQGKDSPSMAGAAEDTEALVARIARQLASMRPWADDEHARAGAAHVLSRGYALRLDAESRRRMAARTSAVALRIMMRTYGSSLRACGVPPERFVPPLRSVLQRAVAVTAIEAERAMWIVRSGVLWGIEGYYSVNG
jgi:hypothetical protein